MLSPIAGERSEPPYADPPLLALVLPDLRGGGVEHIFIVLAEEFVRRGFRVDMVLLEARGELIGEVPIGVRVVDLEARRIRGMVGPFARYLRRQRPKAVLVALWPLTVAAALAHRVARSRARLVLTERNTLSKAFAHKGVLHHLFLRLSAAAAFRVADAVLAISNGVAAELSRLAHLPASRFPVIHNPLRLAIGDDAGAGHPNDGSPPLILAVGSLKPQKNHALLLRAFARLLTERPARLIIAGEGPLRPALEAAIRANGLAESVELAGFVDDVTPLYRRADLFVLTSDWEGFGNVIVEALACGVPVVSTDCPSGPAEILAGGRYGELTPCGDAEALAAAMARALKAPPDAERLRRRAADFSVEAAAEAYLSYMVG